MQNKLPCDNRGYPIVIRDGNVYHYAPGYRDAAETAARADGVADPKFVSDARKFARSSKQGERGNRDDGHDVSAEPDPVRECRQARRVGKCEKCLRYGSPDRSRQCPYAQGE